LGTLLICNLTDTTGAVTSASQIYLPSSWDLAGGLPTNWSSTITLRLAAQGDSTMVMSFRPAVQSAGATDHGICSYKSNTDPTQLWCGNTCNPRLVEFVFDDFWTVPGTSTVNPAVVKSSSNTVLFVASAGLDVQYSFKLFSFQPKSTQC
jgi:hypothetical protein